MYIIWSKCDRTIEVTLMHAKIPLTRLQITIATSHKAFHISDRKKKSATFQNMKLEKAYDKIPMNVMWWALDKHKVPTKYVGLIKDMYNNVVTSV